jgi:hypothetical protein
MPGVPDGSRAYSPLAGVQRCRGALQTLRDHRRSQVDVCKGTNRYRNASRIDSGAADSMLSMTSTGWGLVR